VLQSAGAIRNPWHTSFMHLLMARKALPFSSGSSILGHSAMTCCSSSGYRLTRACFSESATFAAVALMHRSTISCSFADSVSNAICVTHLMPQPYGWDMTGVIRAISLRARFNGDCDALYSHGIGISDVCASPTTCQNQFRPAEHRSTFSGP
jgi:hypothetical protein